MASPQAKTRSVCPARIRHAESALLTQLEFPPEKKTAAVFFSGGNSNWVRCDGSNEKAGPKFLIPAGTLFSRFIRITHEMTIAHAAA